MDISVLGIDLGKNVCSVVGLDASGAVVMRRKVRRETLIALAEKLPPCVVGMEACCGAHHLGRVFAAHGHDVRLMSPEYVRPYIKAQKNDDRDAEGIAEAATRPTMRFVELKSQDQLDMQTLHRSRDRLVGERTALINQLRAILLERGMVAPQGKRKLEQFLPVLMDEQGGAGLSSRMIVLVADARTQWAEIDRRIAGFDTEFVRWVKENEEARRLMTIPGVGAIVASALVAAVGQAAVKPVSRLFRRLFLERLQVAFSKRCVAKLWRNVCNVTRLVKPAALTADRHAACNTVGSIGCSSSRPGKR